MKSYLSKIKYGPSFPAERLIMFKRYKIALSAVCFVNLVLCYSTTMHMPKQMAPKPYKGINNPNIHWKDVIQDNVKYHSSDFCKVVLENNNPAFKQILHTIQKADSFIEVPESSLLLYGKTGSGKTTIAEVIAQKSGKFYTFINAINLMDPYESTVTRALEKIKKRYSGQHIIVLDNIECLCEKEHVQKFATFLKECRESNKFIIGITEKLESLPLNIRVLFGTR